MIYIGSLALNEALGYKVREPKDYDFICSYNEFNDIWNEHKRVYTVKSCYPANKGKKMILLCNGQKPIEAEIAWERSTAEWFGKLVAEDSDTKVYDDDYYPSLDALYMLKMSHRYLRNSPHFNKTRKDIQLMQAEGAMIRPEWMEFYKARQDETYWYKHPKLNQTKDDFFKDDKVQYLWDHDDLHQSVRHLDKPAYEYYKIPGEEVQCSKEMFFDVAQEVRLYGVLEEAYTLALERSIIPRPGVLNPTQAFLKALEKVCTSITSGWFRQFAYDHYDEVVALFNPNYIDRFQNAVKMGQVKPFNPATAY